MSPRKTERAHIRQNSSSNVNTTSGDKAEAKKNDDETTSE